MNDRRCHRCNSSIALRALAAATTIAALAACSPEISRNPVPAELAASVQPFGRAGLRNWGDQVTEADIEGIVETYGPILKKEIGPLLEAGEEPLFEFLALSGGGQFGAFGAGILYEWSERGTRPEFRGVSGISTGAIIAPFAFLGGKYDDTLLEIYSQYSTADLLDGTFVSGLISGTSLADTSKLGKVIARYVTAEMLEAIAAEHRKGRLLFIGTTNMDAGRPVIWNIGAIADSGEAGALELVRELIRASAAIPVAFPPIFLEVKAADGTVFDEMHVDGGAASQVTFISPEVPLAKLTREVLGQNIDRRIWVIVNNDLEPPHHIVQPRITSIGDAAVSSLIRANGTGDVYRLFAIAQRDEIDFNVTWIPGEIPCDDPQEDFDKIFMRCLFEVGRDLFRQGELWRQGPPFFALPGGAQD